MSLYCPQYTARAPWWMRFLHSQTTPPVLYLNSCVCIPVERWPFLLVVFKQWCVSVPMETHLEAQNCCAPHAWRPSPLEREALRSTQLSVGLTVEWMNSKWQLFLEWFRAIQTYLFLWADTKRSLSMSADKTFFKSLECNEHPNCKPNPMW